MATVAVEVVILLYTNRPVMLTASQSAYRHTVDICQLLLPK